MSNPNYLNYLNLQEAWNQLTPTEQAKAVQILNRHKHRLNLKSSKARIKNKMAKVSRRINRN